MDGDHGPVLPGGRDLAALEEGQAERGAVRGQPDLDPAGDDVHRPKDVAVAADGTVYFNVGSSSNANPDDRTMTPPRAVIMSVRPDGTGLLISDIGSMRDAIRNALRLRRERRNERCGDGGCKHNLELHAKIPS